MNVLDFVDVGDLAVIASMSSRNRQLIVDYYLNDLENSSLQAIIYNKDQDSRAYYLPVDKNVPDDILLCTGHQQILTTLEAFCSTFSDLDITFDSDYELHQPLTEKLSNLVNDHCSTVSQKITIRTVSRSAGAFTFENASSVSLRVATDFTQFAVEKHFPRVEKLAIHLFYRFTLKQYLPDLRHFELTEHERGLFDLRAFGELNPQIQSITLETGGLLNTLHEVNEVFPNLEALSYKPTLEPMNSFYGVFLGQPALQSNIVQSVRFRNVKRYTLDLSVFYGLGAFGDSFTNLMSVNFDRLESLEFITQTTADLNVQLAIIYHYNQLRSLTFTSFHIPRVIMEELVSSLPQLKELKLSGGSSNVEEFLQFMDLDSQLETLHVLMLGGETTRRQFSQATLPGRWVISEKHLENNRQSKNLITFKRKKSE